MGAIDDADLQGWLDKQVITDLLYRYSDIVTRGAWDEDRDLYTPDAVLEIASPFGTRVEGADAIRTFRAGTASFEFLRHTTYSPVVHLTHADHARVTSQTHEMVRNPAGEREAMNAEFYSVYYDDVVRTDAGWRFAHRRCVPTYLVSGGLDGSTPAPRASLG
jgi:hypothetical protein